MRRIGVLGFSNPVSARAYFAKFAEELANLGWIEGQNLQLIYRYADGDAARLPALAAELVALEPDVLFATSPAGSLALAHATSRIPIVASSTEPVAMGLVKSLAHPGGNVTGTASFGLGPGSILSKRLEILKGWLPRMSRVALIYNPVEMYAGLGLGGFQDYANRLGARIEPLVARNPVEIRAALDALSRDRPDALYLVGDAANFANRELICTEAARMHLPTMTDVAEFADAGCLAGYSYSTEELMRDSVQILDQILRGASPADIPVRQANRLELVINSRTAASIGLPIPPSVRLIATRVIE
jgi:putative ABC transport system substrate-binding protein